VDCLDFDFGVDDDVDVLVDVLVVGAVAIFVVVVDADAGTDVDVDVDVDADADADALNEHWGSGFMIQDVPFVESIIVPLVPIRDPSIVSSLSRSLPFSFDSSCLPDGLNSPSLNAMSWFWVWFAV
jgi:hypothetical protein